MLNWLRHRSHTRRIASALYDRIVAQSRLPAFYARAHVPDTIAGRFDMIVLHLFLVLERLRAEGVAGHAVAAALGDAFIADLDAQMREMGVGDMAVPKRMRQAAAGFLGRLEAYHSALGEASDEPLAAALARNLFGGLAEAEGAARALAPYVRAAQVDLAGQDWTALAAGRVSFPPPPTEASHVEAH